MDNRTAFFNPVGRTNPASEYKVEPLVIANGVMNQDEVRIHMPYLPQVEISEPMKRNQRVFSPNIVVPTR